MDFAIKPIKKKTLFLQAVFLFKLHYKIIFFMVF
jgi:hypothetical protein